MKIAHHHHDWIEINIRRLDGKSYFANATVDYVQSLERISTSEEIVNILFKMGKQQGTYY